VYQTAAKQTLHRCYFALVQMQNNGV
jgi:hypothetical protein